MKAIKKVNIRKFSRGLYQFLDKLPIAVYNSKTREIIFVVISKKKGSEIYELPTSDSLQPHRKKD